MSRDVFRVSSNNEFSIRKYIQNVSPVTAVNTTPVIDSDYMSVYAKEKDLPSSNFNKRNIALEFTGHSFDFLDEEKADWLMIDMGNCRYEYQTVEPEGGNIQYLFFNESSIHNEIVDALCAEYGIKIANYITDDEIIINLLEECLPKYFGQILARYPANRIIILDLRATDWWYSKDGLLRPFKGGISNSWNKRFNVAFEMAKKYLCGCHVIEFPRGVCAMENHKWGLYRIHYSDEFYIYASRAIKIIMEGLLSNAESNELQHLKYETEKTLLEKNERIMQHTADKAAEAQKIWTYSNFAKSLFSCGRGYDSIYLFLKNHGFSSCAFYGMGQAGIWLYNYLRTLKFSIDYVIEDKFNTGDGGQVVPRKSYPYPPTSFIIICDLFNTEAIRKELSEQTHIPFADLLEVSGLKEFSPLSLESFKQCELTDFQMGGLSGENRNTDVKEWASVIDLEDTIRVQEREIQSLHEKVMLAGKTVEKLNAVAAEKNQSLRELDNIRLQELAKIHQMESSFSWRITAPLRKIRYWQLSRKKN